MAKTKNNLNKLNKALTKNNTTLKKNTSVIKKNRVLTKNNNSKILKLQKSSTTLNKKLNQALTNVPKVGTSYDHVVDLGTSTYSGNDYTGLGHSKPINRRDYEGNLLWRGNPGSGEESVTEPTGNTRFFGQSYFIHFGSITQIPNFALIERISCRIYTSPEDIAKMSLKCSLEYKEFGKNPWSTIWRSTEMIKESGYKTVRKHLRKSAHGEFPAGIHAMYLKGILRDDYEMRVKVHMISDGVITDMNNLFMAMQIRYKVQ